LLNRRIENGDREKSHFEVRIMNFRKLEAGN
jgi:hypothetical protein